MAAIWDETSGTWVEQGENPNPQTVNSGELDASGNAIQVANPNFDQNAAADAGPQAYQDPQGNWRDKNDNHIITGEEAQSGAYPQFGGGGAFRSDVYNADGSRKLFGQHAAPQHGPSAPGGAAFGINSGSQLAASGFAPKAAVDPNKAAQYAMIQQLQGLAAGDPNSLAQRNLKQASAQAAGQANTMMTQSRMGGAGAKMRLGNEASQGVSNQLGGQSSTLMKQEQSQAKSALAELYAMMRGQDLNAAGNAADRANTQAGLNWGNESNMFGNWVQGQQNQQGSNISDSIRALGEQAKQQGIDQGYMQGMVGMGATGLDTYATMRNKKDGQNPGIQPDGTPKE